MATEDNPLAGNDLLAAKRVMWAGFLKLSTFTIVGVSILLIGMAVFLL